MSGDGVAACHWQVSSNNWPKHERMVGRIYECFVAIYHSINQLLNRLEFFKSCLHGCWPNFWASSCLCQYYWPCLVSMKKSAYLTILYTTRCWPVPGKFPSVLYEDKCLKVTRLRLWFWRAPPWSEVAPREHALWPVFYIVFLLVVR